MDKKLLALFRNLFALDDKALPDSISPEDFGKLFEKSSGKLFIKPEDFKKLQKTISQKDVDLKKVEETLKEIKAKSDDKKSDTEKQMSEMSKTIEGLASTIEIMNTAQETKTLKEQYPDILPELLQGKKTEEIEKIVDRQREINKKLYGDSQHFKPADYSSEADVDKAINDIKEDKTKNGENSAVDVLKLERTKDSLKD
jgi:hypothetical protein